MSEPTEPRSEPKQQLQSTEQLVNSYHAGSISPKSLVRQIQANAIAKMSAPDPFDSALDLLRRLNPKDTAQHLKNIIQIAPDLAEDLLSSVDQPLTVRRCKKTGREYLICDYNRDGDSYRSPWSNEFDPPLDEGGAGGVGAGGSEGAGEGAVPGERVRKMEIKANEAFDVYRELYYEGGVSSVYFWNTDDGFAGVVLMKKSSTPGGTSQGVWDSIHVFEAKERGRTTNYQLTSTVILNLSSNTPALGELDLSGNMTRQIEQDLPVDADENHIANIGRLVEDMELKMRNLLQEVYFGKAKDIVGDLRSTKSLSKDKADRELHKELISGIGK